MMVLYLRYSGTCLFLMCSPWREEWRYCFTHTHTHKPTSTFKTCTHWYNSGKLCTRQQWMINKIQLTVTLSWVRCTSCCVFSGSCFLSYCDCFSATKTNQTTAINTCSHRKLNCKFHLYFTNNLCPKLRPYFPSNHVFLALRICSQTCVVFFIYIT